ncbi:glycoside hydrolase family 35 protein [Herbiconiux solani]|uniref:glycoside hydrolase family 35 protein n=1 Tax=Herbiconiux solani TaxID=661329 RepID=UPI000825FF57|nr:beta-galactosidase family protein [Herbiconiux solani]
MASFEIGDEDFLLDGEPYRIIAGALHYFRVHPGQWADRIQAAKEMGLNTIETYVAWNEHAPRRGEFRTDGPLDLEHFLRLVQEAGLHAIVRPGPFICAEWDNGGLPGWLTAMCGTDIRKSDARYLDAVRDYFEQLLPVLAPLQIDRGGPVILMQIENEYGAYGSDADYLETLTRWTREAGITVPLTTIDQPTDSMLTAGGLPGLHKTASFGSNAAERLATLRRHQPTGPLMCAEFWDGWFDHWGGRHHTTSAADAAAELDAILAAGASVNIYMFHGGTNFGFTNGANHKGYYEPTTTSYDYDAPLSEDGRTTAKYAAFRDVIARYTAVPGITREDPPASPSFTSPFEQETRILEAVADGPWQRFTSVPSMDDLNAYRGFALYRAAVAGGGRLRFREVRDRAQIFADGVPIGTLEREHGDTGIELPSGTSDVQILVEDEGRVNYGPRIGERKGLIGPAMLDGREVTGWSAVPVPLDDPSALSRRSASTSSRALGPVLASSTFTLNEPSDLHLSTTDLGKGVAWLNGWPLGRFWSRGPQRTLFVPSPATRAGLNELIVLSLSGSPASDARWVDVADLGPLES